MGAVVQRADHTERRREIAGAVWRLAGSRGLEAVTLRQVAAEAGLPPRLLQYYFGTRHQLLLGALEILNAESEERAQKRVAAAQGSPTDLRAVVRAVLMELLPLDDERRTRFLVHMAYFVLFLNDPDLRSAIRGATPYLEEMIAGLIQEAQTLGAATQSVTARLEADLLVAATDGLQAQILLGQLVSEQAAALIDHHLDRIFRSE